jgi:hypothetical protein
MPKSTDYTHMSASNPAQEQPYRIRTGTRPAAAAGLSARANAATAEGLIRWRRAITWVLAVVWLLDAALQYQPYMFTKAFPKDILQPTGAGSPTWVRAPVTWSANLMIHHIVFWNALFATAQLVIAIGIGVGLFVPRLLKPALAASIGWALMVWWLGEGLGGVLAGAISPVMGFPGAVILYALIAVLVWPRPTVDPANAAGTVSVADTSPLTKLGARLVWVVLWLSFAYEALLPDNRSPSALHDMVTGMSDGEPGWVVSINNWGARIIGDRGTEFSVVLAVLFVFVALAVFVPTLIKPAIVLMVVLAALIWSVAENFGGIATGQGTDPNSGPLLAVVALCYWPVIRHRPADRWGIEDVE